MASLEKLVHDASDQIEKARGILEPFIQRALEIEFACSRLHKSLEDLNKVNIEAYRLAKRVGGNTSEIFQTPLRSAQERFQDTDDDNIFAQLRAAATRSPSDIELLKAIGDARIHAQKAYYSIRRASSVTFRVLTSNWLIALTFILAVAIGIVYFFFVGADVAQPFNNPAAVAVSAKTKTTSLIENLSSTSGFIDAVTTFCKSLTEMFSSIAPLLAAACALWAAVRKAILR